MSQPTDHKPSDEECKDHKPSDEEYDTETDEDEGLDEEDDAELLQQRAFERLLPRILESVGDNTPDLLNDSVSRTCLVCPNNNTFKGWQALVQHSQAVQNKRVPQHRGYHRALLEAMAITPNAAVNSAKSKSPTKVEENGAR